MKILALESSATAASVAICDEEQLLAQSMQNTGHTHSQTLLPMVQALLHSTGLHLAEMDLLAVAAGPGSFTGLRIGVAALKGLAWAENLPCAACSTLASMAWNAVGLEGELCAVMDARRAQVYNARFSSDGMHILRLCPDRALSLEDLATELRGTAKPPWLIGDGAMLCLNYLQQQGIPARLAPANLRVQSAWGVCRAALDGVSQDECIPGALLRPNYLRLSQAERERLEREATHTKGDVTHG